MDLLSLEGGGAIESPVGRAEALTYEVGGWEIATVVAIGPRSTLMEELACVSVPSGECPLRVRHTMVLAVRLSFPSKLHV